MERIKKWRNQYVIDQVDKVSLPVFQDRDLKRYRVTFSGRVQNVGFRFEVYQLAKRLELTGYCKNLSDGDVLAELQGPQDRIDYLIDFMDSLKRIRIDEKVFEEIDIVKDDKSFEIG